MNNVTICQVELYGKIEDEEGSEESSEDGITMSGSGTVKSKGRIIDGGNSDEDEKNSDSDLSEEEQGEDDDDNEDDNNDDDDDNDDESFIEIDTEEVFELLAKGKSYATYEGTHCTYCTYCRLMSCLS